MGALIAIQVHPNPLHLSRLPPTLINDVAQLKAGASVVNHIAGQFSWPGFWATFATFVMPSECVRACACACSPSVHRSHPGGLASWHPARHPADCTPCPCSPSRSSVWSQFKMSIRACSHEMHPAIYPPPAKSFTGNKAAAGLKYANVYTNLNI